MFDFFVKLEVWYLQQVPYLTLDSRTEEGKNIPVFHLQIAVGYIPNRTLRRVSPLDEYI